MKTFRRHLTRQEALEVIRKKFHKTRRTHEVSFDPEVIHDLLYGPDKNNNSVDYNRLEKAECPTGHE